MILSVNFMSISDNNMLEDSQFDNSIAVLYVCRT